MRAKLAGMLIVLAAATCGLSQEGPIRGDWPRHKADFTNLDDRWGLKVKSVSVDLLRPEYQKPINDRLIAQGRIVYVLEFSRDVLNYDLDGLQAAFGNPLRGIRHLFLDVDNIAINSIVPHSFLIQGDLSGVKGEAFRVIIEFGADRFILPRDPRGIQEAAKLVVRTL